jgi:nucleoside-diphosphate-sugar epimerase
VRHTLADIGKAQRLLGYEVLAGFEEGLQRSLEALRLETTFLSPAGGT